jgi:spermidine/putrescine transport system permease protein
VATTPRRRYHALLLARPALMTIIVFMLLPMAIAFVYSLMTPDPYGGVKRPFTAASYVRFVYDRDLDDYLVFDTTYLQIFLRSILQAAVAALLCVLIGLPVAWYIATRSPRTRQILVLLVTIPFWTNLLIRTYCWVLLLRDQGLVNYALQGMGVTRQPITFLYSNGAVLLGIVYSSLPFMVLPIYSSLEKVDPRMVEAAYDLYANRWAIMRNLVWPLAKPGIAAGILLVFVSGLGSFLAPDILGGGKKLMIATLIQQQFTTGRDWPFGAALSMILMAFVLGSLMWSAWRRSRLA